ncbi:hypothetical protein C8R45DRAFT_923339 [Mycena sanguinolenta]|nr:hypothetical protein C8R45DRAFT_923339 [Mycena sanguinolenta]
MLFCEAYGYHKFDGRAASSCVSMDWVINAGLPTNDFQVSGLLALPCHTGIISICWNNVPSTTVAANYPLGLPKTAKLGRKGLKTGEKIRYTESYSNSVAPGLDPGFDWFCFVQNSTSDMTNMDGDSDSSGGSRNESESPTFHFRKTEYELQSLIGIWMEVFLAAVAKVFVQATVDGGSETGELYAAYMALREKCMPDISVDDATPFAALQSTDNIPIESSWHLFTNYVGSDIKQIILLGKTLNHFNAAIQIHIRDDLVGYWNNHKIRTQRNKLLPSGVSPNYIWDFPEKFGPTHFDEFDSRAWGVYVHLANRSSF